VKEIYKKVAQKLNLSEKDVKDAYVSFWGIIKEKIESLPFDEDLSEEDFDKLVTSFNIPSLGKLFCTYDKYIKHKNHLKYLSNIYAKNKES